MNIRKISVKSAFVNYLAKTIATLLDGVIFVVLTKSLALEVYGAYSLSIAILSLLSFAIPFGMPAAILRFIPEYKHDGKMAEAAFFIKRSVKIILVIGLVIFAVGIAIYSFPATPWGAGRIGIFFPLLAIIGALGAINRTGEAILDGLFMQVYRNMCMITATALQLALFIVVVGKNLGINYLILALAVSSLFQTVLYFANIYRYFNGFKITHEIENSEKARFFSFSLKDFIFRLLAFFWDMSFDIYIVAIFLGTASAGLFGFASSISLILFYWSPGMVIQPVVSPLFVRHYAKHKNEEALNELFALYSKFKLFFIIPIIAGVWMLSDKMDAVIYHGKYAAALPTLKILVVSVMVQAFMRPLKNVFDVVERNELAVYANIVIIYRVIASLVLIKWLGIIGAAYAYGTSMLLIFLIQLFLAKKIVKIAYPKVSFLKIFINSLVMAISIFFMDKLFYGKSIAVFIVMILMGGAVYFAMSFFNRPFSKWERDMINSGLGRALWVF